MSSNDKYFESLWCKRPLTLQPFLPEDNQPDITSNDYAWLQHASKELSWLLHLKFPKFASYVIYDPNLRMFLDSFLRFRTRPFDGLNMKRSEDANSGVALLQQLDRRIFFLYIRSSTYSEIESLVALNLSLKSGEKLCESCQFGELLCGDGGPLSFPKVMDITALYSLSNSRLTTK
jgi:hypothetical protein